MASVLGFAPSPHFFGTHAYASAKSAVFGMSKAAAAYYAPQNIRINVVAPGLIATPMSQRAQGDEEVLLHIHQAASGRRPDWCSLHLDSAAVYFLSDESRFVTGQVLSVDGGWSVSEGQIPGRHPRRPLPRLRIWRRNFFRGGRK